MMGGIRTLFQCHRSMFLSLHIREYTKGSNQRKRVLPKQDTMALWYIAMQD